MFKVERCNDARGNWSVSHYVTNSEHPTPTVQYFSGSIAANGNALERAAKLALLSAALRSNGGSASEPVMLSTGKAVMVAVLDVVGDAYDTAFNASEPDPDDCD